MLVLGMDSENGSTFRPMRLASLRRAQTKLILRAQQGDRAAFDELLKPISPGLKGFLTRKLGSLEAEDALQEVLITAWNGLPRYQLFGSFKSWMFAIAEYKVRSIKYRPKRSVRIQPEAKPEEVSAFDVEYSRTDLRQTLNGVLAQLPMDQLEVVRLYFEDGLTLNEISSSTGRNLNTVKSQFYAGRKKLLDLLTQNHEF